MSGNRPSPFRRARVALRRARRRALFLTLRSTAWLTAWLSWRAVVPVGHAAGRLNNLLGRLREPRLGADIARALDVEPGRARRILNQGRRLNDRAIFEVLAMSAPGFDARPLIESCRVDGVETLRNAAAAPPGAVLLGMHMGNGILMAARLVRLGLPVSVVYRESRKMPAGFLGATLHKLGIDPIHVERGRAGGNRKLLKALRAGRLVFVLMDQGAKTEGIEVQFLGKSILMPTGIVRLARRTGAQVIPVLAEAAEPGWLFRAHRPVELPGDDRAAVHALAEVMQDHIRAHPGLWAWHHRRWRRYAFTHRAQTGHRQEP